MGLSKGFRTARISRHVAPKPIFYPGMDIGHFKEQIMIYGGPKQFAQHVATVFNVADVSDYYGVGVNKLMRLEPPADSMDWVRDCLGASFDGPTAWDRHMNLHRTSTNPNLAGAPRRGYRGWLVDLLDKSGADRQSKNLGLSNPPTSNQQIFADAQMNTVYDAWHTAGEFRLIAAYAGGDFGDDAIADGTSARGAALMQLIGTTANKQLAYVLGNAVCDGRCGVLGRLLEKVRQ